MSRRYVTTAMIEELEKRLTDNDRAVIRRVAALRFATGGQLTRLHFADDPDPAVNARAARRALLRLTRLECLARLPRPVGGLRAGSAGFVYRLDVAGQRFAEDQGWQPKRRRRRSDAPGTLFLNHTLQVSELHTLMVEADRSGRIELLELTAEPACWRSYAGYGGQVPATLKPDSFMRLGLGDYEDSYFVEVDLGSEGSAALEWKLGDYVAYAASGVEQARREVFPRTIWLAPDQRRVEVIEACIGRQPPAARKLFVVALQADAIDVVAGTSATKS
jgi:Replication-relaxation